MVWFHGYTLLYIGQKDPKCSIGKRTDCNFQASRKLLKWFQVQIHWLFLFFLFEIFLIHWYTFRTHFLTSEQIAQNVGASTLLPVLRTLPCLIFTICMYFGWWDGGSGPPSGNDSLALGCWGHGFGITQVTGSTVAQWAFGFPLPRGQGDWPPSYKYMLERMRVRDTEEEGYMYMFELSYTDIIRKCVYINIYIYMSYILDSFCSLGLYSCSLTHCQAGLGLILSRSEHFPWIAHPSHYGRESPRGSTFGKGRQAQVDIIPKTS